MRRTTSAWFLEQLNERSGESEFVLDDFDGFEEGKQSRRRSLEAVVEKVVESSFAFTTKREEDAGRGG